MQKKSPTNKITIRQPYWKANKLFKYGVGSQYWAGIADYKLLQHKGESVEVVLGFKGNKSLKIDASKARFKAIDNGWTDKNSKGVKINYLPLPELEKLAQESQASEQ